ncbi:uncharacterized protein LOC144625494 isoform X3 [Crassostrea virginica]
MLQNIYPSESFKLRNYSVDATETFIQVKMYPVNKCPKYLTEWNNASKRLGCGKDMFNKDQYMCTPNDERTSLVEFCYPGIMGIKEKGACLEVDKNGILLRRNCTEFKTGCPKSDYYNYDLHKYPECQNINPDKKCYKQHPSCTPINIAENNDTIPIAVILSIVFGFGFVLVLLIVWLRKKKLQKQKTETQSSSNNNSERTRNHDEIETQPLSDVSSEPTGNIKDFESGGMAVSSWKDKHFFEMCIPSQPPKLMVLPKTNCQTWQTLFSLDRVDVPFIKKTHLFIPKEFIVKIRKTKRKEQELILDESPILKWVPSRQIPDSFFSESQRELLKEPTTSRSETVPDSDPPFISEKEVATKENIVPDEEYHLLKTLETGTNPSLQVVPDNVKKYLFSDPNVKAFGIWNKSRFNVFVNNKKLSKEIRNKLHQLNPFFFMKYKLEIETFLKSPNRELVANYALTDLQIKTGISDRRMFEVPLPNLEKTMKDNPFTTSRKHQHEHSFAEETEPLQPKDNELCLSERKNHDNFGTSKVCCLASDNYKKIYDGLPDHQVDLNKKGIEFFYSNGIMLSSEFYVKGLYNMRGTESVFIVLDAVENVPNPFVSVSLVCLRPQRGQQNHVNAVGVIYSTSVDNLYTTETSSEKENVTSEANKSTDTKVFGNRR